MVVTSEKWHGGGGAGGSWWNYVIVSYKSTAYIFFNSFKVHLFILRESVCAHKQGKDRERGRERISSRLSAISMEPNVGLDPMNCEMMA